MVADSDAKTIREIPDSTAVNIIDENCTTPGTVCRREDAARERRSEGEAGKMHLSNVSQLFPQRAVPVITENPVRIYRTFSWRN
jgi:hypothetical protein